MIETKRLILRPWQESEAPILYKYASDPDIGPIAGWSPHASVSESLEIIRTVFSTPEVYAVVLKETGEPVGSCGLMFSEKDNEAEIGYWIGKPFWGHGYIPEAVKALLSRAFSELGIVTVWCSYSDGNEKSKRVIEKCGFTYHHTDQDVLSPLGDRRNVVMYCMTANTYRK